MKIGIKITPDTYSFEELKLDWFFRPVDYIEGDPIYLKKIDGVLMIDDHRLEIVSQHCFQKRTVFERVEVQEIMIRPKG
jgi:hypothetical protein